MKNTWQVQDAKSRFSEFLNSCLNDGPQVVTRRGFEAAVLVPIEEWRKLNQTPRPTLKSLLLTEDYKAELEIPPRGKLSRREIPDL
jgi:prevent-host-death family protein